jgi:hypothetical protein
MVSSATLYKAITIVKRYLYLWLIKVQDYTLFRPLSGLFRRLSHRG